MSSSRGSSREKNSVVQQSEDAVTWDDLYADWVAAHAERRHRDLQLAARDSQRRAADPSPDDLEWLAVALADPDRRWFVAMVYRRRPVPSRLFVPMVRAGAIDCDTSACRLFVEPCVETFGSDAVLAELARLAVAVGESAKLGERKCRYWVQPSSSFCRGVRPKPRPQDAEPEASDRPRD
jgi:hypothetical protein